MLLVGSCQLPPGFLATISIDLTDVTAASAGVQRSYVITTRHQLLSRRSCHDCVSTPAVVVISVSLLYQACP